LHFHFLHVLISNPSWIRRSPFAPFCIDWEPWLNWILHAYHLSPVVYFVSIQHFFIDIRQCFAEFRDLFRRQNGIFSIWQISTIARHITKSHTVLLSIICIFPVSPLFVSAVEHAVVVNFIVNAFFAPVAQDHPFFRNHVIPHLQDAINIFTASGNPNPTLSRQGASFSVLWLNIFIQSQIKRYPS